MFGEDGIFRMKAGENEKVIRILDEGLYRNSPWLRESTYRGTKAFAIRKLRAAAISEGKRGKRRLWHLRETDRFTLPCPIEAVVPETISVNGCSTPYYRSTWDKGGMGIAETGNLG